MQHFFNSLTYGIKLYIKSNLNIRTIKAPTLG